MSYYDSIDDDVKRAKEILENGRLRDDDFYADVPPDLKARLIADMGHISGGDNHAAYKLLESFVAEIARLRAELQQLDLWRAGVEDSAKAIDELIAQLGQLREEVERLRAAQQGDTR